MAEMIETSAADLHAWKSLTKSHFTSKPDLKPVFSNFKKDSAHSINTLET